MESERTLVSQIREQPLAWFLAVTTCITTLWGLVGIHRDITGWYNEGFAWFAIGVFLVTTCCVIFWALKRTSFQTEFHVGAHHRLFIVQSQQKWRIDEKGAAKVTLRQKMFFLRDPDPDDLWDTVFASEDLKLHELPYKSEDAKVVNKKAIASGVIRAFWEPVTGTVKCGEPYEHHCEVQYPCCAAEHDFRVITIAGRTFVRELTFELHSKRPIASVTAAAGKRGTILRDPLKQQRYVLTASGTGCPAPVLVNSGKVTFAHQRLEAFTPTYLLVRFAGKSQGST